MYAIAINYLMLLVYQSTRSSKTYLFLRYLCTAKETEPNTVMAVAVRSRARTQMMWTITGEGKRGRNGKIEKMGERGRNGEIEKIGERGKGRERKRGRERGERGVLAESGSN